MSNIVIKAENLSKYYKLGVINNGTLFRDIQTWWALKHGKQDPHSQIGSHKYDATKEGFWALKDLNFEIKQGDRVGIIGKNGAGKSTLLKVLSRITAPTEGNVKIKGRISSLLEVGTGFHAELTGRENIYLNGAILGMKRAEVTRKMDEIIAFSGIENHIDTPVKRYSSGMYVRLAFAVAAHLDSEILIADEVLAVGDAEFQKKALGKMNELSSGQGRTVLFVSHNMSQIKSLCNKGIVLERGKIVRTDDDINDSIGWYISGGVASNELVSCKKIEDVDCLKNIAIKLIDKNSNEKVHVSNSDELFFEMSFDVINDEDINLLTIGFLLTNEKSEIVFRSLVTDLKASPKIKKGHNSFKAKIPLEILVNGKYKLYFDASIHRIKWIVQPYNGTDGYVSFEVENKLFTSLRETDAVISPPIEWK